MEHITGKNAPSLSVVVPHFIFGAFCWFFVSLLIIIRPDAFTQHYFNNGLLAITHLLVLGWLTMIIWGALYQLIPVIFEVRLFSEVLARLTFYLLAVGVIGLSAGFWFGRLGSMVTTSGIIILISVMLFVFNVMKTIVLARKKGIEQLFIRTSVIWLLITVIIGVIASFNLIHAFLPVSHLQVLKLHAHAGMAGWFFLLVIGVASKLFPMFLVVDELKVTALKSSYFLINTALIVGLVASYFDWPRMVQITLLLGIIGLLSFMFFVFHAYKKRIKKSLDIGMRQTIVAFIFLTSGLVMLIWINIAGVPVSLKTPMAIAYGSAIFIGFFTALTLGQTYKTLPFILWLKHYQDRVGKEKTPMPRDLYNKKMAGIQMVVFALGFVSFTMAVLFQNEVFVRVSGIVLGVSAVIYGFNLLKVVLHKPKSHRENQAVENSRDILKILKNVIDPELMVNIVDLGLVYKAEIDKKDKIIRVEMTLSSQACPLGDAIIENVHQVLIASYPGYDTDIQLVWDPVWTPDKITEEGKKMLEGVM